MKTSLENFVHSQNIKAFKWQLEVPTNEAQRKLLLTLLAEEEAKVETSKPDSRL